MTLKRHLLSVLAGGLALPAAHALADIPLAVVGPMTGDNATFGAQMKAGAEMAVALTGVSSVDEITRDR